MVSRINIKKVKSNIERHNNYYMMNQYTFSVKNKDIFYYAHVGGLEEIKAILKNNNDLLYSKDNMGRTIFYIAARNGYYNLCKYLLNKGAFIEDSQQAPNMYGPSPKYLSNQNGSLMSNQAIQLADMSNMSNINPQPQFIQAYPQRNIYENMYQQNPQYVQYPQYPLNMQQIPYQQNLAQKPYPLVEQVDPNSQAGIIMPVVYP